MDFLKTTVMACAAGATVLGALALRSVWLDDDTSLLIFCLAWWTVAATIGGVLGRGHDTIPAIARLLATARTSTSLPEQAGPGRILLNRLWPLFLLLVLSAGLTWLFPQLPAIAAGFLVIWALSWRRQESAVTAVEERDGVAFYIERTAPWKAIQLVRTPGYRRIDAASPNGAA